MNPAESNESPKSSAKGKPQPKLLGILAILLAVVVIGVVGWLMWSAQNDRNEEETPTAEVSITTAGFSPSTIHIKKGTDVTWTNQDSNLRSLQADQDDLGLKTPQPLSKGNSYSFVFDQAGTYTYYDPVNIAVKGTVVVE